MDDETPGWFTLQDGVLKIWEGVCVLIMDEEIRLYKVRNGNMFNIALETSNLKKVSSDGYWSCVEILGTLEPGHCLLFYHAETPDNAKIMLKNISKSTGKRFSSLSIRLDPDPLRNRNTKEISKRISLWSQLGRHFFKDFRLVLDANMPL
ncbi:unnamed protein product [Cylicostephanus goldi]|uniref:Uncharacterized protein n=1 Tax=Cylicostephanus goldi TaxID=71465 RepID=A0A3P6QRX5_CYLGO|nr:unnamed protein product [Cylicostephanus goldi]